MAIRSNIIKAFNLSPVIKRRKQTTRKGNKKHVKREKKMKVRLRKQNVIVRTETHICNTDQQKLDWRKKNPLS